MAFRGFAVAPADRSALRVVRGEEARTAEAMQDSGELPTKVTSIANPSIHAVAPGRYVLVRRIPSQKHPTQFIPLGHQQVRRPGISHQDLVIKVAAYKPPKQHMRVHYLWRHVLRPAGLQRPDVAIVLCDQTARRRLIMPSHTPALQDVRRRRAKMGHEARHDAGLAVQANTETVAHSASAAVAADEILTADLLGRTVPCAKRSGYPIHVLRQILERDPPARLNARP